MPFAFVARGCPSSPMSENSKKRLLVESLAPREALGDPPNLHPLFGLDSCKGKKVGWGTGMATQLHEFIDKSMILNFTEQVYLIFTVCNVMF